MLNNKKIKLLALLIICFFGFFAFNHDTYAYEYDIDTIMKKWVFTEYYACTKDDGPIANTIQKQTYGSVIDDIFPEGGVANRHLPSYSFGWNDTENYNKINCSDLFNGTGPLSGSNRGVLDYYDNGRYKNVQWTKDGSQEATSFLESIGYTFVPTAGDSNTFVISAVDPQDSGHGYQSTPITVFTGQNGNLNFNISNNGDYIVKIYNNSNDNYDGDFEKGTIRISAYFDLLGTGLSNTVTTCSYLDGQGPIVEAFTKNDFESFRNAVSNLSNRTMATTCLESKNGIEQAVTRRFQFTGELNEITDGQFEYAKTPGKTRYQVTSGAIITMSGLSIRNLNLNNSEKYTLYYYYLDKTLPANVQNRMTCETLENTNGLIPVKLKDADGTFKQCYVNYNGKTLDDLETMPVYIQTSTGNGAYPEIDSSTMAAVIDWFNNVDISTLDDTIPRAGDTVIATASTGNSLCYEVSGNMGWTICDLMERIGNGANELYAKVIEPFLIVNPEVLETNGATWKAWNIMMGFANTLMIIYLMVVIFSQLTGVGITNYGIKKTLPKILVAALLINLSFLICQLAVDVSNILGNALNNLLSEIASRVNVSLSGVSGNISSAAGWFNGLLAGATGGLAAIGVASVVTSVLSFELIGLVSALLIPILMLLVTVIVSILFFFVLLGLRQAGVVIFVIISPLAFACYMLPNTKPYFDKWYKIFKGLLLVYPICGLLVGGGYLTSRILLSVSQDYIMYFTGCIAMVVPFFFIPKILRGAFVALGNIGATLSGVGRRMSNWGGNTLNRTITENPNYQDRLAYGKDEAGARRAERHKKWLENKYGSSNVADWKNSSKRDLERYAKATDTLNAYKANRARSAAGVFGVSDGTAKLRAEAARDAQEYKAASDEFAGYDPDALLKESQLFTGDDVPEWFKQPGHQQKLSALINAMENNGQETDVFRMLEKINTGGEDMAKVRQNLANSENKLLRAYGKKGKGLTLKQFATGEDLPTDEEGNILKGLTTFAEYADDKGLDIIKGMDHKTLKYLAAFKESPNALKTYQLIQGAAQLDNTESIEAINKMLEKAGDLDELSFSIEQLLEFTPSTINTLGKNEAARKKILEAYNKVMANPILQKSLKSDAAEAIEKLRTS